MQRLVERLRAADAHRRDGDGETTAAESGLRDRLLDARRALLVDLAPDGVVEARGRDRERVALAPGVDLRRVAEVVALAVRAEAIRVEDEEERAPARAHALDGTCGRVRVDLVTSVVSSRSVSIPNAAARACDVPGELQRADGVDCA